MSSYISGTRGARPLAAGAPRSGCGPLPTRCAGGAALSAWRGEGPARSDCPGRRSPGGPSAARNARRIGRPAPRRCTSTPSSPGRSTSNGRSPVMPVWKATAGRRPSSRTWRAAPASRCAGLGAAAARRRHPAEVPDPAQRPAPARRRRPRHRPASPATAPMPACRCCSTASRSTSAPSYPSGRYCPSLGSPPDEPSTHGIAVSRHIRRRDVRHDHDRPVRVVHGRHGHTAEQGFADRRSSA
ncbi:hypothetical protein PSN13_01399 [Micromonospora saelicesensis]|uniref:Uncharacterized protein n=1 Tax=Micromonospora saelicesensis TaxID=285676 RepID=A0A328NVC5_9ACTN|nr:hypothetical protein PSN13_01399 [Micromonospora saelicesensis]